jgi:hypothetical protein
MKWLTLVVLVLLVLAGAMGIRNLVVNGQAAVAGGSAPVPPSPWLMAGGSAPVPPSPWFGGSAPVPPSPW